MTTTPPPSAGARFTPPSPSSPLPPFAVPRTLPPLYDGVDGAALMPGSLPTQLSPSRHRRRPGTTLWSLGPFPLVLAAHLSAQSAQSGSSEGEAEAEGSCLLGEDPCSADKAAEALALLSMQGSSAACPVTPPGRPATTAESPAARTSAAREAALRALTADSHDPESSLTPRSPKAIRRASMAVIRAGTARRLRAAALAAGGASSGDSPAPESDAASEGALSSADAAAAPAAVTSPGFPPRKSTPTSYRSRIPLSTRFISGSSSPSPRADSDGTISPPEPNEPLSATITRVRPIPARTVAGRRITQRPPTRSVTRAPSAGGTAKRARARASPAVSGTPKVAAPLTPTASASATSRLPIAVKGTSSRPGTVYGMPPPSRQSEEAASTPPNSSSSYGPYYRNGFSMDSPAEAMSTPGLSDCDSDLSSVSTTPTLTPASVRFPSTLPRMVTWSTREPSISEIAEEATAAASNSSARALGLCPPPSDDAAIDNLRHSLKCQLSSGELDPPIVAQFARYERDISRVRKLLLRSAADRSPSDMRWVGRVAVTMLTGFGAAGRDLRGQMRWLEMVRPHLPNLRAITSNMILDTAWRVWHRMLQPMKLLPDEDATLYTTFAELYDSTLPRALTLGQPVLAALSPTIEAVAAAAARLRAARHAMCEEMIFVEQRLLADPATCERIHAVRRVQESIDHGKGRMVSDGGWSDVSTIGSDTATAEPPLPEAGDGGGQGQAKFAHALEALALDKAMHGSPGLSPQD